MKINLRPDTRLFLGTVFTCVNYTVTWHMRYCLIYHLPSSKAASVWMIPCFFSEKQLRCVWTTALEKEA